MLSATDAWLTAQGMMIAQGDGAIRECETILAGKIGRGDTSGAENWTKILTVICKVQKQKAERARVARTAPVASACA